MFTEGSRGSGDQPRGQIFTEVGNLKGTMVAIKKVRKRTVDLNRAIRKELKVVSRMYQGFVIKKGINSLFG